MLRFINVLLNRKAPTPYKTGEFILRACKRSVNLMLRSCYRLIGWVSSVGSIWTAKRKVVLFADKDRPTFFGYHYVTPFNKSETKILAMSVDASDTDVQSECTPARVGYFKTDNVFSSPNEFNPVAETTTWCWQQGCMLQWHPWDEENLIIFNSLVDGAYGSCLMNVESSELIREYKYPIYSLSSCGNFALTLNFARLGRLRPGYGYPLLPDATVDLLSPEDDGLFLLNLESGQRDLLVSLSELAERNNDEGSEHYVNHALFSPDGRWISFLHLFVTNAGKRKTYAYVYDRESNDIRLLEAKRSISHHCWINYNEFLLTTKDSNNRRRISVYGMDTQTRRDTISLNVSDTHPMKSPVDENTIVMDSYPDKFRNQHLYIGDISNASVKKVASLYSPREFSGQVRCDLHPRWDRTGRAIVVDTAIHGRRKMALLRLDIKSQSSF